MTDINKLKEATCKEVNSMLLSGNQAVTLRQLEKDYRDFMGARIPFQAMGYVNLESFLRDNASYFKLYWDGAFLMVKHVTNADTEHIQMMLNRQRPKRPRKRAPIKHSYYGSSYSSASRYPKPLYQPEPLPAPPRVPSTLRGEIRGLLLEYTSGLLGSNFDAAYAKRYSSYINFKKMGFDSLLDMLKSMSDIVSIVLNPSGIYKIFPRTTANLTRANIEKSRQTEEYKSSNHSNLPPRLRRKAEESNALRDQQVAASSHQQVAASSHQQVAASSHRESQRSVNDHSQADQWQENVFDKSGVNHTIQREIQQLLSKHKEGLWSTRFQAEYRAAYRKELDLRNQGYNSVINLMADLPHLVTIERANQRDWLLHDARHQKPTNQKAVHSRSDADRLRSKSPVSPTDRFKSAPSIDEDVKETLRQVVAYHQRGVLLDELPAVYKRLTGDDLEPRRLGYANFEKLVIALDDVVNMEYKTSNPASPGKLILYPQFRETVPNRDKLKNLKMPPTVATPHGRREIPVDVVGPESVYRQQTVPYDSLKDSPTYIEVYVSTVISPSHFWLQLKHPDTTDALEALMDRLEDTYCNTVTAAEYTLPDDLITLNQVCAAVYPPERDWHRCRITGFKGMDFVELYYVDYGSTHSLARKSLKFLKWKDFELPAQGIPAKLSNIKAKDGEWTREARDLMLQLVSNRAMIALVTDVALDGTLSICLTDTSGEIDIHVNDELVSRGLAVIDLNVEAEAYLPPTVPVEEPITTENQSDDKPTDQPEEQARSRYSYSGSGHTGESECERHIKYVQLTPEYSFHIICHSDQAYVTSGEISSLLWPGSDILRSMMRQKQITLTKVVLPRDENAELFEEFKSHEVGGTIDIDGKLKTHVTMFELKSVVDILDKFEHPSEDLKTEIQRQSDVFTPLDPYWKGADSDDEDEEEDDDCIALGRQTLEMALQSLQFKRKRILQAMQQMDSDNTINIVEELQIVEKQLRDFKDRLKALDQLEKSESTNDAASGGNNLTVEDDWVCSIVAEQSESYLKTNNIEDNVMAGSGGATRIPPLNSTPRSGVKTNPVAPMPAEPKPQTDSKQKPTQEPENMATSFQNPLGATQNPLGATQNPLGATQSNFGAASATPAPLGHSLFNPAQVGSVPDISAASVMNPNMALLPMMSGLDLNDPQTQQRMFLFNQYQYMLQTMVNVASPSAATLLQNPLQAGILPMQTGINPVQAGFSPLPQGINPVQSGFNPLAPGFTPSGLGTSVFGRGSSSQGLGSSIGMAVGSTTLPVEPLGSSLDPSLLLQGRGRGMAGSNAPPGGLQKRN